MMKIGDGVQEVEGWLSNIVDEGDVSRKLAKSLSQTMNCKGQGGELGKWIHELGRSCRSGVVKFYF